MSRPIIGIAANQLAPGSADFFGNSVSYTPLGFVNGIQKVGGLPILLPIGHPEDAKDYVNGIDKLLLAGGQDVSPYFYNEEPHHKLEGTNFERDLFEKALIEETLAQNKPIFAVCRGLQLLNVALGGNLHQDLSLYPDWVVKHVQNPTPPNQASHSIVIEDGSLLKGIIGQENYFVNSYHHQAIKRLSQRLKATAWSSDQLIEAVEWRDGTQRVIGIQWHPELTFEENDKELQLFHFFVNTL